MCRFLEELKPWHLWDQVSLSSVVPGRPLALICLTELTS